MAGMLRMPTPDLLFIFKTFMYYVSVCLFLCVCVPAEVKNRGVSWLIRIWWDILVGPGCLSETAVKP